MVPSGSTALRPCSIPAGIALDRTGGLSTPPGDVSSASGWRRSLTPRRRRKPSKVTAKISVVPTAAIHPDDQPAVIVPSRGGLPSLRGDTGFASPSLATGAVMDAGSLEPAAAGAAVDSTAPGAVGAEAVSAGIAATIDSLARGAVTVAATAASSTGPGVPAAGSEGVAPVVPVVAAGVVDALESLAPSRGGSGAPFTGSAAPADEVTVAFCAAEVDAAAVVGTGGASFGCCSTDVMALGLGAGAWVDLRSR